MIPLISLDKPNLDKVNNIQEETLSKYMVISRKCISAYIKTKGSSLDNNYKSILSSDEVVSYVTYNLVIGDRKFNGKGTLYGYRKQRAAWAIGNYLKNLSKQHIIFSLDGLIDENHDFHDAIPSKEKSPLQKLIDRDGSSYIHKIIDHIGQSGVLNTTQMSLLKQRYFEGLSDTEIANNHKMSRQNVHKTLQKVLVKIRPYFEKLA